MSEFKSWEEMSELEQLACEFWDFYKEAHGFRPRHVDTTSWTVEQFHSEFEQLARVCKQNAEFRKESEAAAAVRFEARIVTLMASGAGDRATAIRWVAEADQHGPVALDDAVVQCLQGDGLAGLPRAKRKGRRKG